VQTKCIKYQYYYIIGMKMCSFIFSHNSDIETVHIIYTGTLYMILIIYLKVVVVILDGI